MGSGDDERRQQTILVVDDYDGVRAITKRALEMHGYRVVEAANGEEAIKVAEREFPNLILMDLSMPVFDGFAAIHRIRRLLGLKHVPIIAVSAHTASEVRDDALAAGCCEYVSKPVKLEILLAAVERHLGPRPTEG